MIIIPLATVLSQVLGIVGLAPAPETDASVVVVVLPTDAVGLPVERRTLVAATIESRVDAGRVTVAPREAVAKALVGRPTDCGAVVSCRDQVAAQFAARFVVQVSVTEPTPSDYDIRVAVYDVGVAEPIARFDDACTICSEADLERIVRERALDASEAMTRALSPPLDERGEARPAPAAPRPTPVRTQMIHASSRTKVGWALVGGGVAATLGGVVLLALQGSTAGCPADPRGGPCIPLVYRTVAPGAIAAGVGVALAGAGVGLVLSGKRRDAQRASARLSPGAAGISLAGRF